jgi:flagellar biosynthesis component FlhA
MKEKREKQLLIKVTHEEKHSFKDACEANDTSVSRELRAFMKNYVDRNSSHRPILSVKDLKEMTQESNINWKVDQ